MNEDRIIHIDFARCFRVILEKWATLLLFAAFGLIISGAVTLVLADQENTYEASASVYCVTDGSYTQTAESVQMMLAYVDVIKSSRVAERANSILGNIYSDAQSILEMIEVRYRDNAAYYNSMTIQIIAESTDEQEAMDIANAMAEAFTLEMAQIMSKSDVQTLDRAQNTTISYNAEKQNFIYLALGAIAGMMVAAVWIVLKEIFAINLNTVEDGTLFGKLDVIGAIPDFRK